MPRKFTKFPKSITASTSTSKLYKSAQSIADDISEFLNATSRIDDIKDYLDDADIEAISNAMDALYDFAQMYSHVEASTNCYVRCTSDNDVASIVQEYIQDKVDTAGEFGFIDGDWFAYCQDEAFYYGSIGKCIRQASKFVASHPDCDEDDIIDFLFDSGALPCYYSMRKIVNAFKRHGKFDQIPEWFFE